MAPWNTYIAGNAGELSNLEDAGEFFEILKLLCRWKFSIIFPFTYRKYTIIITSAIFLTNALIQINSFSSFGSKHIAHSAVENN